MTGVRHDTTRASVLGHWLVCALVVSSAAAAAADQSREDAWWTGPMLAPSAATLPTGHMLLEPYLFDVMTEDRKSTRLNSSHVEISYAVFCLKKKKNKENNQYLTKLT